MSLFPREMTSERLRYERLHPDDVDPLDLYDHVRADAPGIDEITEYVTWDPHETPRETAEFVEQCGEWFDENEAATYVLRPTEGERAGELAGVCGLHVDWEKRVGIPGIWLRKPFWGRGYSGERAERLCELAFERLDLELVAVTHDTANDRSRRAIEKYVDRLGGRRAGRLRNHVVIGGEPRDAIRYSISRAEFRARD